MKNKNHKIIKKQDRKKLKMNIRHKVNELEQEKIILQALRQYLEEEKKSFDNFAENISDKIKNPIVPVKAYVDMLLEGHFGDLNEKQKEKLKVIRESVVTLNERISKEY